MVPNGWLNTSIDDNISFSGGAQPPREVFKFEPEEGYIRLIQIRDYKTDKFVTYVPEKLAKKFCTVDDVMIGRYGPPIFQILRGIEGAYNVALIKAIPKDGVDKEFMYYFLKRDPLLRVIESYSQRTSGQTGIEMDVLKAYPMHLPPLPEQRKIAKILSTWDKAIATTEKLIETSKQQKKALMQQLLTGKKRLVNPETGKAFEGEWEEVKVNALITKHSEKTVENKQYPVLTSSRKGIFFQSDYYNDRDVASEDTTGYNVVPRDYFTYRHMSDDLVFKFNRNTICDKGIVSTLYPVFSAKEEVVVPYLLQAILNEGSAFKRFSLSQKQGGSRTYMYLSKLNELTIQIPSITEQQKIASVLTAADQEIEVLEAKLAHFKQEKKALMQQLLTGKRRVKVDEEVAA
ncbi:restriction endonuclease subunit S [Vibrio breoganii]